MGATPRASMLRGTMKTFALSALALVALLAVALAGRARAGLPTMNGLAPGAHAAARAPELWKGAGIDPARSLDAAIKQEP
jgi:hypothetical protein